LNATPKISEQYFFWWYVGLCLPKKRKEKKNYAGVITPQAWIKETETLLSDSEVLTLPGGFKPGLPTTCSPSFQALPLFYHSSAALLFS
jgi:hypothetical protein